MATNTKLPESLPDIVLPGEHGPKPPRSGKSRKRGLIWVLFLVIIAGVAGYAVWRASQPASRRGPAAAAGGGFGGGRGGRGNLGPVPVVVQKVGRSSIPVYLNGLGNVTAFYTVTVKTRVAGQIMKFDVNEGDFVKAGQTLIQIDPRPYQVALDQAVATMAHDQALLDNANVDLKRYQLLVKTDAIPSQQLDTQGALVAQYQGTIKQDQANIDAAKLNLVYAKVTAPITGVVGLRTVDPGNIVQPSDANGMIVITQLQPISVLFTIPEDSLPQVTRKLRAGAKLPADAWNRDNSKKIASGMLVTLDNQIDNTTGTSKLKAVFDNTDNSLFPQQFVNIRLLVDTLTNQLVIPNVAIQNGQQGTFVYVVDDDNKVHLKPVQVGVTTQTSADILGGISDEDRVVVDGTDRLIEGATVRVRKAGELANPPGFDGGGRGGRGGRGGAKKGDKADSKAAAEQSDDSSKKGGFKKGDFKKGDFKKGQRGGDTQ